jgi:hypothetical protein
MPNGIPVDRRIALFQVNRRDLGRYESAFVSLTIKMISPSVRNDIAGSHLITNFGAQRNRHATRHENGKRLGEENS